MKRMVICGSSVLLILLTLAGCEALSKIGNKVSGKYIAQGDSHLYDYFDFDGSVVRISTMGLNLNIAAPYKIDSNQVIISDSKGSIVLRIEDKNTLVGIGWPIENVRYVKE
jgi:hypothetical protein